MAQRDLFANLAAGEFDGITIPVVSVKLRTGSAAAFHRYPFRAGVDIEYTGREPVSGVIQAAFFRGLFKYPFASDDLWPGAVTRLRERVQEQRSGKLVIPPLGTLDKAKIDIEEDYSPTRRDGCLVTISFVEDSKERFVKSVLPSAATRAETFAAKADLKLAALKLSADLEDPTTGVRLDFASFLSAVLFQINLLDQRIADRVYALDQVIERCNELIKATTLRNTANWETSFAIRRLADSVIELKDNLSLSDAITLYTTAATMPAAAVAAATRNTVEELLELNPFENANAIAEGVDLLVYDRAA